MCLNKLRIFGWRNADCCRRRPHCPRGCNVFAYSIRVFRSETLRKVWTKRRVLHRVFTPPRLHAGLYQRQRLRLPQFHAVSTERLLGSALA